MRDYIKYKHGSSTGSNSGRYLQEALTQCRTSRPLTEHSQCELLSDGADVIGGHQAVRPRVVPLQSADADLRPVGLCAHLEPLGAGQQLVAAVPLQRGPRDAGGPHLHRPAGAHCQPLLLQSRLILQRRRLCRTQSPHITSHTSHSISHHTHHTTHHITSHHQPLLLQSRLILQRRRLCRTQSPLITSHTSHRTYHITSHSISHHITPPAAATSEPAHTPATAALSDTVTSHHITHITQHITHITQHITLHHTASRCSFRAGSYSSDGGSVGHNHLSSHHTHHITSIEYNATESIQSFDTFYPLTVKADISLVKSLEKVL